MQADQKTVMIIEDEPDAAMYLTKPVRSRALKSAVERVTEGR